MEKSPYLSFAAFYPTSDAPILVPKNSVSANRSHQHKWILHRNNDIDKAMEISRLSEIIITHLGFYNNGIHCGIFSKRAISGISHSQGLEILQLYLFGRKDVNPPPMDILNTTKRLTELTLCMNIGP